MGPPLLLALPLLQQPCKLSSNLVPMAAANFCPPHVQRSLTMHPPRTRRAAQVASTTLTDHSSSVSSRSEREGGGCTCITCGIGVGSVPGFQDASEQRAHFKADWHRSAWGSSGGSRV